MGGRILRARPFYRPLQSFFFFFETTTAMTTAAATTTAMTIHSVVLELPLSAGAGASLAAGVASASVLGSAEGYAGSPVGCS